MDIQKILDEFAKSKFSHPGSTEGLYNSKPIAQYDLNGNLVKKYTSFKSLKKETGLARCKIIDCLKNKRSQSKGYVWKYAE